MKTNLITSKLTYTCLTIVLLTSCVTARVDPILAQQVSERIEKRGIGLTPQLIERFEQIAFGSEYGHDTPLISSGREIRIRLVGETSPENESIVHQVIADLDALLVETRVYRVDSKEQIQMAFLDQAGFVRNAPEYAHDNNGYFYIRWHPKAKLVDRGKILVRKDVPLALRRHVVREEITQILGLMRDIESPGSIFSQSDGTMTVYSPLDQEVIRLWEALRPMAGQARPEVIQMLRSLTSEQ